MECAVPKFRLCIRPLRQAGGIAIHDIANQDHTGERRSSALFASRLDAQLLGDFPDPPRRRSVDEEGGILDSGVPSPRSNWP